MINKKQYLIIGYILAIIPNTIHLLVAYNDSLIKLYFSYIVDGLLIIFTFYFFLIVSISSPGYQILSPNEENPVMEINKTVFKLKFCKICNIFKHPRTKHCKICEKCIESLDFHSFLVGKCIGRKNKREYFGLTACYSLQSVFLIIFCFDSIFNTDASMSTFFNILLLIHGFTLFSIYGTYFILQIYLVSNNLSFQELLKRKYDLNVFTQGWRKNWDEFFSEGFIK